MPFEEQSFDLVVSCGYYSRNPSQLSMLLVPEIKRLSRSYAAYYEGCHGRGSFATAKARAVAGDLLEVWHYGPIKTMKRPQ